VGLLHCLLPQYLKNGDFHQRKLYRETLASSKKDPADFKKRTVTNATLWL